MKSTDATKKTHRNEPESLPFKQVWLTGASSGIGKALAESLSHYPINLVVSSRKQSSLEKLFKKPTPANISYRCFDLEDGIESKMQAELIDQDCGGLDLVILCAGMLILDEAWEIDATTHKKLMDVNYFSPVSITNTLIPRMRKRGSGHIVVISSVTGYVGTPLRSAYAASKHALQGYFDTLRAELHPLGPFITVVNPGFIDTGIDQRAFNGKGQLLSREDLIRPKGMPPNLCAEKIIEAILARKEEIYIGGSEIAAIYLQRFCPRLMRKIAPFYKPCILSLPKYHKVELESGDTHFRIYGSGPQKYIILNGLTGPLHIWEQFLGYFNPDIHTLLLYDYYGRGYSREKQPIQSWDVDAYAKQLKELLKHLSWLDQDLNVIAYSWACGLAAHLVSNHAINVKKLILIAPTYYKIRQITPLLPLMIPVVSKACVKILGVKLLKTETYRHAFSEKIADEYWLLIKDQCKSHLFQKAFINTLQAKIYRWPGYFRALKNQYQGEIHIIIGEYDSKSPGSEKLNLMKLFNHPTVSIIRQSKHLLPFEKPSACAEAILSQAK